VNRLLPVVASLLAILQPGAASSFQLKRTEEGVPLRWPDGEVRFTVNRRGSADVRDTSDLDAVRAAFQTWGAAAEGQLSVESEGATAADAYGYDRKHPDDNENLVAWIEEDWPFDENALAVTLTMYRTRTGELVDADIMFNGEAFTWTTQPGKAKRHDIQNSATHEVGHLLGLGHEVRVPEATMFPDTAVGETSKRSLHPDDLAALSALYPAGGLAPGAGVPDAIAVTSPGSSSTPPVGGKATEGRPTGGESTEAEGSGGDVAGHTELASPAPDSVILVVGCSVVSAARPGGPKTGQLWPLAVWTSCAIALLRGVRRRQAKHAAKRRRNP